MPALKCCVAVLIASCLVLSHAVDVNVIFSGGGIRAAVGAMTASFLVKQYTNVNVDEVHGLSGGSWGMVYAQEDFGPLCSLLAEMEPLGPTAPRWAERTTFWQEWAGGLKTSIIDPVKAVHNRGASKGESKGTQFYETRFKDFTPKWGRKVCATIAQQEVTHPIMSKISKWFSSSASDLDHDEGNGVRTNLDNPCDLCIGQSRYYGDEPDRKVLAECAKPLAPGDKGVTPYTYKGAMLGDDADAIQQRDASIGQKGRLLDIAKPHTDIALLDLITLSGAAWGFTPISMLGAGAHAPKVTFEGRDQQFIFSDGGFGGPNLPAAVTILKCLRENVDKPKTQQKPCPPLLLFDYTDAPDATDEISKLVNYIKEQSPGKINLMEGTTQMKKNGKPSCVQMVKWPSRGVPLVSFMFVGLCYLDENGEEQQFTKIKDYNTATTTGAPVTWSKKAFGNFVFKYSQFLQERITAFNLFLEAPSKFELDIHTEAVKQCPKIADLAIEYNPANARPVQLLKHPLPVNQKLQRLEQQAPKRYAGLRQKSRQSQRQSSRLLSSSSSDDY